MGYRFTCKYLLAVLSRLAVDMQQPCCTTQKQIQLTHVIFVSAIDFVAEKYNLAKSSSATTVAWPTLLSRAHPGDGLSMSRHSWRLLPCHTNTCNVLFCSDEDDGNEESTPYTAVVSGPCWTVPLKPSELSDFVGMLKQLRSMVANLAAQGQWHGGSTDRPASRVKVGCCLQINYFFYWIFRILLDF